MPRVTLTDIVLKTIKPQSRQTQYWDASLRSFGCRVSPGGTKTFNVMLGQDRRLIKIGNYPSMTLATARRRAHEIIDEHDPRALSFIAARDLFFVEHLSKLKETTAHEQKNLMRRFPFTKPLTAISADDVNRVLKDMPPGSARSCFNVIRTFFNWCVANDYLEYSPLKRSPYKPRFRDRLLTDEEVRLIWQESHNHTSFGAVVRLLLLTGQRLNQITSFRSEWLHQETIHFPAHIMKSNVQHTIPLLPFAKDNLIFFDKPFSNLSDSMNKLRAELSDVPHWTLHDFRRYFSSTMAKIGTPIDITEAILDHRSGSRSQVQRIYDRYDRLPHMRSALERYENYVVSVVERTV